ncbi:MAG TPA: hypothetical protein VHY32_04740 [Caulobacteraceae bacterium]|jgi:hypothetical protein|nr:hypothetical protein [Caulobacteraceae bacterium]
MACWIDVVKDWQTLIAGVLAIVAAFIGGGFVWLQTQTVDRREQARLERQHKAALAVLPLAISAFVEYAQQCAVGLLPVLRSAVDEVVPVAARVAFVPPVLDSAVIPQLRDAIENAPEGFSDRIAALIAGGQVLASNLRSLPDKTSPSTLVLKANIEEYIARAGIIFARGAALFEYARGKSGVVPPANPSEDDVRAAINVMSFEFVNEERIYDIAFRLLSGVQ